MSYVAPSIPDSVTGYSDILAHMQAPETAERDAVVETLIERLRTDPYTIDLCLELMRRADICNGPVVHAVCTQVGTVWRAMLASATIDAVLAVYTDTDANSLEEMVEGALEVTDWWMNPPGSVA